MDFKNDNLEQEYFNLFDKKIIQRNSLIAKHFGNNFLEEYTKPDQRLWYKNNIGPIDAEILQYANFISGILLLNKTYNKVADVFKDRTITTWYNTKKIEQNKALAK